MVKGVAQLTKKLTVDIPARVKQAARDAMEQGAEETVQMMKRLVPVDGGKLRDSIGWTWGSAPAGSMTLGTVQGRNYKTMRITIYAGDESTIVTNKRGVRFQNARLQEFGTQAMAASPYFFTSWRAMKKRVKSRMTRNVRKAMKPTVISGDNGVTYTVEAI